MDTMNSLSALPEDFEGKVKVNHWWELNILFYVHKYNMYHTGFILECGIV